MKIKKVIGYTLLVAFIVSILYMYSTMTWIEILSCIGAGIVFTGFLALVVWLISGEVKEEA